LAPFYSNKRTKRCTSSASDSVDQLSFMCQTFKKALCFCMGTETEPGLFLAQIQITKQGLWLGNKPLNALVFIPDSAQIHTL